MAFRNINECFFFRKIDYLTRYPVFGLIIGSLSSWGEEFFITMEQDIFLLMGGVCNWRLCRFITELYAVADN